MTRAEHSAFLQMAQYMMLAHFFRRAEEHILLNVDINSMDRYFAGAVDESTVTNFGGYEKFGIKLENTSTGEVYDYPKLSDFHIYETLDDVLSDDEVALGESSPGDARFSQDVVFYKQGGQLHFRTTFDDLGTVKVSFYVDTNLIEIDNYELTADVDIAELIDAVDAALSDELVINDTVNDGPITTVAALSFPSTSSYSLMTASSESFETTTFAATSSSNSRALKKRNLTTKACIPIWDRVKNKFNRGVAVARETIKLAAIGGQGFVYGMWQGVKDDAQALVELGNMILHPVETSKSFYEGFKALKDLTFEQLKAIPGAMVQQFLEGAEQDIAWAEPDNADIAIYVVGFSTGYLAEQILVAVLTGGAAQAVKGANIGATIANILNKVKAGEKFVNAATTVYQRVQKVRAAAIRRLSSLVETREGMQRIKTRVTNTILSGGCPVLP